MEWFNVGRIVNTHGIRGELRIISTTPFKVLKQLFHHPLTAKGIEGFLADWAKREEK